MHRAMLLAGFGLILVLAAPGAGAAINKSLPYEDRIPYDDGFRQGVAHEVVSGRVEADLGGQDGSWGFANVTGAAIRGIEDVCWYDPDEQCRSSPSGDLRIEVVDGSGFGIRFPGMRADASFTAAHALALFVDFSQEQDLQGLGLGKTFVAAVVDGEVAFTQIPNLSGFPLRAAEMVALDDESTLEIYDGSQRVTRLTGTEEPIRLSGDVTIPTFRSQTVFLPFEDGASASFGKAKPGAAGEGLEFSRLNELTAVLEGQTAEPSRLDPPPKAFQDIMERVLASAILVLPGDTQQDGGLVRFTRLQATADGDHVQLQGRSPLEVEGDQVRGAKELVGWKFFQFPPWAIVLWVAAIAVIILNVVLKRPKKSETWDQRRWIGWVASILLALLSFVLWDLETRAVWGVSVFSSGLSAPARGFVFLLETAPLAILSLVVALPLAIILRGASRALGQGKFMGIPSALSYPLSFLLCATYLRAYLELFIGQVIGKLG